MFSQPKVFCVLVESVYICLTVEGCEESQPKKHDRNYDFLNQVILDWEKWNLLRIEAE